MNKLEEAAKAGSPDALFRLGYFLINSDQNGSPTPENQKKGKGYLLKAAEKGDVRAKAEFLPHAEKYHLRSKETSNRFKERDENNAIRFYKIAILSKEEIKSNHSSLIDFGRLASIAEYSIAQIYESRIGTFFPDAYSKGQAIEFYDRVRQRGLKFAEEATSALERLGVEQPIVNTKEYIEISDEDHIEEI